MSRMYNRLHISLPAIVMINPDKPGERILLLITVNVSASGAMFYSELSISPNTPVKVVFLLKRGHFQKLKVMFSGRVTRCEPGRFAVAFDEVHPLIMSQEGITFRTVD